MVRKSCEQCGNSPVVTVCWLISTVGVSPRVQKCSKASIFCWSCMQRLLGCEPSSLPSLVRQRFRDAYTATLGHSQNAASPANGTEREGMVR